MSKQENRRKLATYFLQGLQEILKENPTTSVITVKVKLEEVPDYNRASTFSIDILRK